jgi:hypothetical protein
MLLDILTYVRECVARASYGSLQGALNWSSIVGAAVIGSALYYFGLELSVAEGYVGAVVTTAIYLIVAWIVFFVLRFLLVSPFVLFHETASEKRGAENKIDMLQHQIVTLEGRISDLTKPYFEFRFFSSIVSSNSSQVQVLLLLELINTGTPAAALASTWALRVMTSDGSVHEGNPITIGVDPIELKLPEGVRRFVREDSLDLRAGSLIDRLGYKNGVLTFMFGSLSHDQMIEDETVLVISVQDVLGREFSGKISMAALQERSSHTTFLTGLAFPHFLPR